MIKKNLDIQKMVRQCAVFDHINHNGTLRQGGILMVFERTIKAFSTFVIFFFIGITIVQAADVNFNGQLDYIQIDEGGGVYSGVSIGTDFNGIIDDVDATGFISDGTTLTSFGCCIAAGRLSVTNNMVLSADDATFLNEIIGSLRYNDGDIVDVINIEGDKTTSSGGRIEIGISYILPSNSFDNDDLSNYPVNQADIELALFFIYEEDNVGQDIYSAGGQIQEPTSCIEIAGQWEGNWSETSCDTFDYSGPWTGTVSNGCIFIGTDNWDTISGTIDPSSMMLTATGISQDGCGSINVTGTFTSDSVTGSYTYSVSGSGTFTGIKNNGNTPDDGGDDTGDGGGVDTSSGGSGGGGGCFIDTVFSLW